LGGIVWNYNVNQLVGNNQIDEMLSQLMTSHIVTSKRTLEKILKDIKTKILETKYTQLGTIIIGNIWY
jgi:hypothetical protein